MTRKQGNMMHDPTHAVFVKSVGFVVFFHHSFICGTIRLLAGRDSKSVFISFT